jgi:hypothetical protein
VKLTLKAGVVAVGVLGSQIAVAVPSIADTADDPCGLAVSYLCRFIPIAPDLDGDVDLTTPLPPTGDAAPAPDSPPPADVCTSGCLARCYQECRQPRERLPTNAVGVRCLRYEADSTDSALTACATIVSACSGGSRIGQDAARARHPGDRQWSCCLGDRGAGLIVVRHHAEIDSPTTTSAHPMTAALATSSTSASAAAARDTLRPCAWNLREQAHRLSA